MLNVWWNDKSADIPFGHTLLSVSSCFCIYMNVGLNILFAYFFSSQILSQGSSNDDDMMLVSRLSFLRSNNKTQ